MSFDSIYVTEPPIPELQGLVIDSISCAGEEDGIFSITGINGGTAPFEVYLNGDLSAELITGLAPGNYLLEIIDANGCEIDSLIQLDDGPELSILLDPIIELTFGEFGTFQAAVNVDSSELNFIQWSPAENLSCDTCLTTFVQGLLSGTYTINVATAAGCDAQASIQLLVNQDINITVPNIFTPNNDGINEGFTIYSDDSIDRVLTMYTFLIGGVKKCFIKRILLLICQSLAGKERLRADP